MPSASGVFPRAPHAHGSGVANAPATPPTPATPPLDALDVPRSRDHIVDEGAWRVSLFGPLQIHRPHAEVPLRLSPRLESLLGYLLLNRAHAVPRQSLIDALWADRPEASARQSLATALWRLRRSFEDRSSAAPRGPEARPPRLHLSAMYVRIEGEYLLDIERFEQAVRRTMRVAPEEATPPLIQGLEDAVRSYRGDLLEGLDEDWAVRERERFQLMLEDALAYLMRYHASSGATDLALSFGNLLLQRDVLREDVHREMMRLYMRTGRRALALRQYDLCHGALAAELGIPPMEETRRVRDWVAGAADPDTTRLADSLPELAAMLNTVLEAQRALREALDGLSRWTDQAASAPGWPPEPQFRAGSTEATFAERARDLSRESRSA